MSHVYNLHTCDRLTIATSYIVRRNGNVIIQMWIYIIFCVANSFTLIYSKIKIWIKKNSVTGIIIILLCKKKSAIVGVYIKIVNMFCAFRLSNKPRRHCVKVQIITSLYIRIWRASYYKTIQWFTYIVELRDPRTTTTMWCDNNIPDFVIRDEQLVYIFIPPHS